MASDSSAFRIACTEDSKALVEGTAAMIRHEPLRCQLHAQQKPGFFARARARSGMKGRRLRSSDWPDDEFVEFVAWASTFRSRWAEAVVLGVDMASCCGLRSRRFVAVVRPAREARDGVSRQRTVTALGSPRCASRMRWVAIGLAPPRVSSEQRVSTEE